MTDAKAEEMRIKESLDNGQKTITVTGISRASAARKESLQVLAGQSVHEQCRHEYCNKNCIDRDLRKLIQEPTTSSPRLRSQATGFRLAEVCLFCGQPAKMTGSKRGHDVYPVRTRDFQTTILSQCKTRRDTPFLMK